MLESEADAWLERNRDKLGARDRVSEVIEEIRLIPGRVLEIGCANGWRLAKLRDKYNCEVFGVEPSRQGCIEAAAKRVPVAQSSAAVLPVPGLFDVVIYGFCLYLTDPADWLRIAAEGDCLLKHGGALIIHDFAETMMPYARRYEHRDDMLAYHIDFAKLWMAHPLYTMITRKIYDGDEMVTVLKKLPAKSIWVRP
jgi:SAM-dependent methyltransferase